MNKKKYITVLLSVILSCCAAAAFAATGKEHKMHSDTKHILHSAEYTANNCSVKFDNALRGHTDGFTDRAEDFLEDNAFWEDCVMPVLNKGENAHIDFNVFTAKQEAQANEISQAVRAAISFVKEFNDYVEDVQEYTGLYEHPQYFTYLKVPADVNEYKGLVKEVKKSNRSFKTKHSMPKVHITVNMMKAQQDEDIGSVNINMRNVSVNKNNSI